MWTLLHLLCLDVSFKYGKTLTADRKNRRLCSYSNPAENVFVHNLRCLDDLIFFYAVYFNVFIDFTDLRFYDLFMIAFYVVLIYCFIPYKLSQGPFLVAPSFRVLPLAHFTILRKVTYVELLLSAWASIGNFASGVATGGMGGSGPPTSVQTPPEICANPLKSVLYIGGGGPMHVYCNFLLLTSKEKLFGPPTFLGWILQGEQIFLGGSKCENFD